MDLVKIVEKNAYDSLGGEVLLWVKDGALRVSPTSWWMSLLMGFVCKAVVTYNRGDRQALINSRLSNMATFFIDLAIMITVLGMLVDLYIGVVFFVALMVLVSFFIKVLSSLVLSALYNEVLLVYRYSK